MNEIDVIAFDADDTLWENEPYFREAEEAFCDLLEDYLPRHTIAKELFKTEMDNLALYGYGIKGFMLCMIETISRITEGTAPYDLIDKAISIGKAMLDKPVELISGVDEVLDSLFGRYRLVMATKGDLLDQERKLKKSGLEKYFHHIEIMTNKKKEDFETLIRHLDCEPSNFVMIGNSLKSDVLPVLAAGAHAIHVPFHITWHHEHVEPDIKSPRFHEVSKIRDILDLL